MKINESFIISTSWVKYEPDRTVRRDKASSSKVNGTNVNKIIAFNSMNIFRLCFVYTRIVMSCTVLYPCIWIITTPAFEDFTTNVYHDTPPAL